MTAQPVAAKKVDHYMQSKRIKNIIAFLFNCPMCGLSFPVVSKKLKKLKVIFLSEGGKRTYAALASNRSWESHQKKSGSFLVNHDLGDQLKIVLCLF